MKHPAAGWRSVLIVDDDRDTRQMYGESLQALGFDVKTAASGVEAIRLAVEQQPAVVVTDLRLKGEIDGLEVTRRLRDDGRTKDVRVIVLTGAELDGERERARASGADRFLVKPCLPETLAAEIRRVTMETLTPRSLGSPAQRHRVGSPRDRRKA
jgi:two-component system cell cycle response regulator DivK